MKLRRDWLKRDLNTFDIYSLVHSDSQSTYYLMIGFIALYAGGSFLFIALYAVILMILIALIYGEMGSHFPEVGGSYIYVRYSLGSLIALISVWLLSLDQIIMISYGTLDAATYLRSMLELYHIHGAMTQIPENIVALILSTVLFILTLIGIRESARVAMSIAILDIILVGFLSLYNIFYMLLHQSFYEAPQFMWKGIQPPDLLLSLALASRGFTGLDSIGQLAGEARKPLIQIPRATILVIMIGAFYSLSLSILLMNMIPHRSLQENPALAIFMIAERTPYISLLIAPLIAVNIILIMLMAALTGYVAFSRLLYILSQDRMTHQIFGRVHPKFRTPYISLVIAYLISLVLIIPGEISLILEIYAIGSLINYLIVAISLGVLSRRGVLYGGFSTPRIRDVPVTVLIGTPIMIMALAFNLIEKYSAIGVIGIWAFIGIILYLYMKRRENTA